jgi:23S rRNA pseudouridine2605 synthase
VSKQRIQKVLAQLGLGSRRKVELWIVEGRIKVDGKVAILGDQIDQQSVVELDGQRITLSESVEQTLQVLLYHKPVGEVCTRSDTHGRAIVYDKLPKLDAGRWIGIGRLDINTTGLLLFTNDGELANQLMHPRNQVVREYMVRVLGRITNEMLTRLQLGVELEDGVAKLKIIKSTQSEGINQWFHVAVREGRNRIIRRLWESQNVSISRLIRVAYGPIKLPKDLKLGDSKLLTAKQIKLLQNLAR